MRTVVSRDYPHEPAPHREGERRFQETAQVFMERGLVYNGAAVLAAQIRGPRRQRDDLMPRRKANAVRENIAALVLEHYFLDRLRRLVKSQRPARGRLDKLERHVLVVLDIPAVDSRAPGGRSAKRPVSSLGPGNPDPPRFFADLDLRLIGNPPP